MDRKTTMNYEIDAHLSSFAPEKLCCELTEGRFYVGSFLSRERGVVEVISSMLGTTIKSTSSRNSPGINLFSKDVISHGCMKEIGKDLSENPHNTAYDNYLGDKFNLTEVFDINILEREILDYAIEFPDSLYEEEFNRVLQEIEEHRSACPQEDFPPCNVFSVNRFNPEKCRFYCPEELGLLKAVLISWYLATLL